MARRKKIPQADPAGEADTFVPRATDESAPKPEQIDALKKLGWKPERTIKHGVVWIDPKTKYAHTWPVAVLVTTTPEPDGEPFAPPEDLRAVRRAETIERRDAARLEKLTIQEERQAAAERRKAARALKL